MARKKKEEKPQGKLTCFTLSLEALQEFYARCLLFRAETEQERIAVLVEMANEGWVDSVSQTGRTKQQYIEDMSKEFTVLDLTEAPYDEPTE